MSGPVPKVMESLTIDYCVVEGGSETNIEEEGNVMIDYGTHNSESDPLLVNGYRLSSGSPGLDAGNNSRVPLDATDIDGDGNTVEKLPVDVDGKIRFADDPVADTGSGTPPLVDMGACERIRVIYVDVDALGNNNGVSWYDAYHYVQDALTAATTGYEIWVAQGTYKPDRDTAYPAGTGSRGCHFSSGKWSVSLWRFCRQGTCPHRTELSELQIGTERRYRHHRKHRQITVTMSSTQPAMTPRPFWMDLRLPRQCQRDQYKRLRGRLICQRQADSCALQFIQNIGIYGGGVYTTVQSPTYKNCAFSRSHKHS